MTQDQIRRTAAIVIASLWAIVAFIVGITFITTTKDIEYGGDAYSGIQQAAAQTARAVGWVIIGTGVLGFIIALAQPVISSVLPSPIVAPSAAAEDS